MTSDTTQEYTVKLKMCTEGRSVWNHDSDSQPGLQIRVSGG